MIRVCLLAAGGFLERCDTNMGASSGVPSDLTGFILTHLRLAYDRREFISY